MPDVWLAPLGPDAQAAWHLAVALLGLPGLAALGAPAMSRLSATWRLLRDDPRLVVLLVFWRVVYPVLVWVDRCMRSFAES